MVANTNKDVQIKLIVDNTKFVSGINVAKKSLDGLSNSSSNLGSNLDKSFSRMRDSVSTLEGMSTQLTIAGAALGAMSIFSLKAASDIEQLGVSFEVLTGSAQTGANLLNQIRQFSAVTPFVTQGLAENAQMMMAFGIQSNQVMPTLKLLGDVSMGNTDKMNRLTLAYSQVTAAGKMMGQDLLQMVNAGFNPLLEISAATGISMGQLRDMMSKGAISTDLVTLAFQRATTDGGRFHDMMEKQSGTLAGRFSTLIENVQQLAQAFGAALAPTALAAVDVLINLTAILTTLPEPLKACISQVVTITSGLLLLAGAIPTVIKMFEALRAAIILLIATCKNVITVFVEVTRGVMFLVGVLELPVVAIAAIIAAGVALVANWKAVGAAADWVGKKVSAAWDFITGGATKKAATPKKGTGIPGLPTTAELDKQINDLMKKASGIGGKLKTGRAGRTKGASGGAGQSAQTLANQEVSNYKTQLDNKLKLDDQYQRLSLALAGTNTDLKNKIELDSENKKFSILKTELTKLGVSRQQIENTASDQLYKFDLNKFKGTQKEKIAELTLRLNEQKIKIQEQINQNAEYEKQKAREVFDMKQRLSQSTLQLQQSRAVLQNAQNPSLGGGNIELQLLQQQAMQQEQLLANARLQVLQQYNLQKEMLTNLTEGRINAFSMSQFSLTEQKKLADDVNMLQQMEVNANNTNTNIAQTTQQQMTNAFQGILSAGQGLFDALSSSGQNWGQRMFSICKNLISLLSNALRIMNSMGGSGGGGGFSWGGFGVGIIKSLFGGGFASGGIIPGSYSQAQMIKAHGSEMVLNPAQQAQLFNLANGGGITGGQPATGATQPENNRPIVVINNNIQSLEPQTAAKLVKDQMPYIKGQIIESMQTESTMRGVIKRAVM